MCFRKAPEFVGEHNDAHSIIRTAPTAICLEKNVGTSQRSRQEINGNEVQYRSTDKIG